MIEILIVLASFALGVLAGEFYARHRARKAVTRIVTETIIWTKDYCDAFPDTNLNKLVSRYIDHMKKEIKKD